jgi:L-amino acid N-acyltransferase YncA
MRRTLCNIEPTINDIYNATIVDSHVSFDTEPGDMTRRATWWERYGSGGRYCVLVAEIGGNAVGAAFSGPYRDPVGPADPLISRSPSGGGGGRALP